MDPLEIQLQLHRDDRIRMGAITASGFNAVSCVTLCLIVLTVRAFDSDNNESLEDVVRTLKGQVNALLERRQEDFRILEESIRHSLDKNSELATVKSELDELRYYKNFVITDC